MEEVGKAAAGIEMSDSEAIAPSLTSQISTTILVGGASEVGEDFVDGRRETNRRNEE